MYFPYRDGILHIEDLCASEVARRFGTPCYAYSRATIQTNLENYQRAFARLPHLICYAVKANSNLSILKDFARYGTGFDIVSGGELARTIAVGVDPQRIVFSGVGKSAEEIQKALAANILCFNVESISELDRLQQIAQTEGKIAPISLRVNPDVNAQTHPYIATGLRQNKFGVPFEDALAFYLQAQTMPNVKLVGIACHIGSQINEISPYLEALDRVLALSTTLATNNIKLQHIDLGGGIGIAYQQESTINLDTFAQAIQQRMLGYPQRLLLEPGRSIVGSAGILLTRVEYLKPSSSSANASANLKPDKHFAIVDAGMNDLVRPALYQAHHRIIPIQLRPKQPSQTWQIVGPVCETADFLGFDRLLALDEGDLLAIMDAGAYGFTMSSNYNTRTRPAEVLIDGAQMHLIRPRETIEELLQAELAQLDPTI